MNSWPQSGDRLLPFLLAALLLHGAVLYAVRLDLPSVAINRPPATVLDIALELTPTPVAVDAAGQVPAQAESRPGAIDAPEVSSKAGPIGPRVADGPAAVVSAGSARASAADAPAIATSTPVPKPLPRKERVERAPARSVQAATEAPVAEAPVSAVPSGSDAAEGAAPPVERPRVTSSLLDRQISEWTASYTETRARESAMPARTAYVAQVTTHRYAADAYERAWQDKVERIGNLNYPEEARRKNLSGGLLLTVGVNADGSLKGINVVKSSGHAELDEAAVRIVRLAAPFAPFPSQLKADYDVLVITRTWRFFTDHHLSTAP
ncbi:TonB family protein [Methylolobus aquaticus]